MEQTEEISKQEGVKQNELATEKIGKLIKKFSIPCIISLLVSALYNIVDQIFIGQGVGYLGNTATNIVFPLTVIALAFSLLIGDGAAAHLSLSLGKNDRESAKKGIGNGITLVVLISIIFLIIGLVMAEPLLKLFGVTQASYGYAKSYMFYIVLGLPFFMLTNTLNSMIRADGAPTYAMRTMLIGAIINVILDPIAIFVLKWGVEGAAIATVVGQVVSGMLSILYIKKYKTIEVTKDSFKIKVKTVKNILGLGISSFITQISITIVLIVMNQLLAKYGAISKYGSDIPLSALGIVMKVNQIVNSVIIGIAVGAQPILGFNYGAKQYKRVVQTFMKAIQIGAIITIIGTIIFQLCPQIVINLFGQENGLYNEFAQKSFKIFLMFILLNSFQMISGIFMQAIGKPMKSAIISLSRQILFLIPAMLILSHIGGIEGILFAGPTADGLAFVLAMILVTLEIKQIKKLEKQEVEE
ncbi:MAG: MATE family efflux transporter [Clostridia bacterium]